MALHFTAETHFGDHRMINFMAVRALTGEMDRVVIERWNAAAAPLQSLF